MNPIQRALQAIEDLRSSKDITCQACWSTLEDIQIALQELPPVVRNELITVFELARVALKHEAALPFSVTEGEEVFSEEHFELHRAIEGYMTLAPEQPQFVSLPI